MSKISRIQIKNFKAIEALEADFKGCTAIITGGNNKGKSSFLRGLPDRIRFIRPDVIVKEGKEKGSGEMVLTTGERFVWEFDVEGKDKMTFITSDGVKQSVTKELSKRFFPAVFDIDKFLQSSPKEQSRQLQQIIGIDFTDIDQRYKIAYDDRTEKNRDAERFHAKLVEMLEVPHVDEVDISGLQSKKEAERERLNSLYLENKAHNEVLREAYNKKCREIDAETQDFNNKQADNVLRYNASRDAMQILQKNGYGGNEVQAFIDGIRHEIEPQKIASDYYPIEPTYINEMPDRSKLDELDNEILEATQTNIRAAEYKNYVEYKKSVEAAKDLAKEADDLVKSIEAERAEMIRNAKFPKGIAITSEGITVDGFPLDRNQISTSKLYTSALRIAAMNLGAVKTLYFDASFLDRDSLAEIEQWAAENDLQLLIERPDYDGGEIRYELIEEIKQPKAKKTA